jgi:hypothetical protein
MERGLLETPLLEVVDCFVTVTTTGGVDSLLTAAPYPDVWGVEKTGFVLRVSVGEGLIVLEL